jgi:poly(hydroxyalkanoate) depolymerase family esterase
MRRALSALVAAGLWLCPAAVAAGHTETGVYGSGASAYPYRVYVPSSYSSGRAAPLLVMAHGCQTTAEQQQRANLLDPLADREGFIVLYPDVNDFERGSQPGPLKNCWQFFLPSNAHRDSGDPAAIAGMTRTVTARWNVDGDRVYMVGMSAGSFMTSIMAAAYPDLFAAVVINAGGAYNDGTCLGLPLGLPVALSAQLARAEMGDRARIVPRLVMGGDADQGIPPGCADKALEQALRTDNLVLGDSQTGPISLQPASVREQPADKPGGRTSTVKTYLDPAGCEIGERWLIHGMNHFWPGGSTDPKLKGFTDPTAPNGGEIAWTFLKRYVKSETSMPCAEASAPYQSPQPATTCPARWRVVRVPAHATHLRATAGGRAVRVRHAKARGTVLVHLPATQAPSTTIRVRGRTAAGRPFTRSRTLKGC